MKWSKLLYLPIIFILSCSPKHEFKETSFYYWKTVYELSAYEIDYAQSVGTKKIYFKAFDVMNDDPIGVLLWEDSIQKGYEYIPVVFIDHEMFRNREAASCKSLASNVLRLIEGLCKRQNIQLQEIQIDCDWTKGTKDSYFIFLEELKKASKCILSTTIRLHQIKFKKSTGIPPCDYGVLMCYNMGNLKSSNAKNSIYDADILHQYLKGASYKLPLKVALPIFDWMLWYRGERFVGILYRSTFQQAIEVVGDKTGNAYRMKKDTFLSKKWFKAGDYIRDETVSANDLLEMKEYLSHSKLKLSDEIIYFSLDSTNISQYEKSTFTH